MSADNSTSNLPQTKLPKNNIDLIQNNNPKSVLSTNGSEIQKIIQDTTPSEEIIKFIEERDLSDMAITCILEKILHSHRPVIHKLDIINITLGKIEKSKVSGFLTYKSQKENQVTKKTQDANFSRNKVCYFFQVVLKGDLELLDLILKQDFQINFKDNYNKNALFYAINADKGDNVDIVLRLINAGVNVNEVETEEEHSPLTLASKKNMRYTVKALLEYNANPNHKDKNGNTALHFAIINKSTELVRIILSSRPDLNSKNKDGLNQIELSSKLSLSEIYNIIVEEYNTREEKAKIITKEFLDEASKKQKVDNIFNNISVNSYANYYENLEENQKEKDLIHQKDPMFRNQEHEIQIDTNQVNNQYNNNYGVNLSNQANNIYNYENLNSKIKNNQVYMQNPTMNNQVNNIQSNQNSNYYPFPHQQMMNFQGGLSTPQSNNNSNKKNKYYNNNHVSNSNNNLMNNQISNGNGFNQNKRQTNLPQTVTLYSKENNNIGYKQVPQFKNVYITVPCHFNENKLKESQSNGSTLNDHLKFDSTPQLTIDLSDDSKVFQLINGIKNEDLQRMNVDLSKTNSKLELEIKVIKEENSKLIEELNIRENRVANLNGEIRRKEDIILKNQKDFQIILEEKNQKINSLLDQKEKLEKELNELKNREMYKNNKNEKEIPRLQFLDKKFSLVKYDDKYSGKCLQKDLLDFLELTKDQIKKLKFLQEELIRNVQEAVNEITNEFEVKLYGSHATNLCLPWSDVDIVIISKVNYNTNIQAFLQSLKKDKKWKKSIKYIESAAIPIIKMTSTDQFNNMQIDISVQDQKHYGIRCVELVKSFLKEYEVLEPLILALKNILKYANLNDPYTGGLSSYGLILMVVSFLQSQLENKKSIKLADIGMIFLEFLWYYGYVFDHSKYVIYAYPPNDSSSLDREAINNFFLNIQSAHELIIVDPLSKTNNVAKSTYQYVNIKMAFMIAFVVAHEDCECGCHYNKIFDDSGVAEHCILKRIFLAVKRFNSSTGTA